MMPTISGDLRLVTTRLDTVTSVSVRARETRAQGSGLVLGHNDPVQVDGGHVTFTAVPGPAVLALSHGGMVTETVPLLVPDVGEVSLADAVRAASLADDVTLTELEHLAAQAVADVTEVRRLRGEAERLAQDAEAAAAKAEKAVDTPGRVGPPNVLKIGTVVTGATAKAEVTGTAPEQTLNLTLPKGNTGAPASITLGTVTTLAAGQPATASVTGTAPNFTLSLGIPQGAAGSTAWSAIPDRPSTFPPAAHSHPTAQVDGLDAALVGKADTGHKHVMVDVMDFPGLSQTVDSPGTVPTRGTGGSLAVPVTPTADAHAASKKYVDAQDATVLAKVQARPALFSGTGAPPASIPGAVVGDWWLDTTTMQLYKITGV